MSIIIGLLHNFLATTLGMGIYATKEISVHTVERSKVFLEIFTI